MQITTNPPPYVLCTMPSRKSSLRSSYKEPSAPAPFCAP